MAKHIILQTTQKKRVSDLKGVVRINAEAEETLLRLVADTGLPMREIASQMIIQGADLVKIIEVEG